MAVVNIQESFVYLANPGTASRATTSSLLTIPGSIEVAHHHAKLERVVEYCPGAASCRTVFHTVRHPCDWLLSRFLYPGGNRGDWFRWIKQQPNFIFNRFIGQATEYAKYENLAEDLLRLTGHTLELEWLSEHRTPGKKETSPAAYWNSELLAWAKRYFQDFKYYGYE
jgi:hypothetical protein